ncbi:hypothetical protein Ae406Ps2_4263 [Pseudonocardia sp. Ae406_Ps2]|nr:hypothetical protein Ae331Ps2_1695c [Pseudonocardia sp. Ae331_Ps2]OLM04263.1 hypothetical protein Ae406Ps2_4263 [Pseudonocardia sp. Ae406_Ps2]OLM10902.1 hypothetical protein Ae505Ps2_1025c [Pseudonocardia sp. Ae505_Ps2]OLM25824.1 hypothetical protein Ae706Ps2_4257 [Pseudonocardia sp. Ae706_Ps2]
MTPSSPRTGGSAVTADTTTSPDLLVLHTLRLSGFVAAPVIARRTELDHVTVDAALAAAAEAGRVKERTGRVAGWTLTAEGRTEHARLLAAELDASGARAAVERAEARFLELNQPFKEICSRWQVRPDGTPNDHSDPAYDRGVVDELGALHPRAVEVTAELAGVLPRFGRYPRDLAAAWERVDGGETTAFAAPLRESYHDVWMELHQDLMSTLGRERGAADGH